MIKKLTLSVETDIQAEELLPTCGNMGNDKSYVKCGNELKFIIVVYKHEMWKHEATLFVLFLVNLLLII